MIYLFTGRDVAASAAKRDAKLEVMLKAKPHAEVISLTEENWQASAIDEYAGAQGLFQRDFIISASFICDNKEFAEELVSKLDVAADSVHAFLFLERGLTKDVMRSFSDVAEEMVVSEGAPAEKGTFNVFSLADALGRRDKKGLWVLLQEARREGIADEVIHGTLWWQVKTLLLSAGATSAKEAGISEYPFKNAKRFLPKFGSGELESLSEGLVTLYHDARRGRHDLGVALERFVLSV